MAVYRDHLPGDVTDFYDVINPSTAETIAQVGSATQAHVEHALATAYRLFRDRQRWLPLHQRIQILEKVAVVMQQRFDELAHGIAEEGGKPLVDARVETARAIEGIKRCVACISAEQGSLVPMGAQPSTANRVAFTQKEPIGVVVAVSAFNHPLNLIVHQVATAIASGCPCVVKPSGDTPLSCLRLASAFTAAGLPDDFLQVITTNDVAVSEALVTDQRLGFFTFIGSARVGWMLRAKLQPGVRCALEHGGVAPVIVTANADLERAVPALAKGGFYHAGQVCVSTQRIFVHESIAADFVARLAQAAGQLSVGDATAETTDVGPLIRPQEVTRVAQWVSEAQAEGAELVCGGEAVGENFYAPTLLLNPDAASKVSTEEVFGPVVCVYIYKDLSDAIGRANSLPVAFQGAVFSNDIEEAMVVYRNLDASTVMINDHSAFREDAMPFAGLKHSGLGVGGIDGSIHDMQIEKLCVIHTRTDSL